MPLIPRLATVVCALIALAAATPADAATRGLPSARVGGPLVLDRVADPAGLEDPSAATDATGTTYVSWGRAGSARLCVLPVGAARCSRLVTLPALHGSGFHVVLGGAGAVTLVFAQEGAPGDQLLAATSTDGGRSFAAPVFLASLPTGSRLTSVAGADGAVLAAAVSPVGVTVRAVRLDADAPAEGDGALFPGAASDANVALSSTGPVLVVRSARRAPAVAHYAGDGTADDALGWTGFRSTGGLDDGLSLVPAPGDPVLVLHAGSGRRLLSLPWRGDGFGRATAVDAGSRGEAVAAVDRADRLTVARAGGSAGGLLVSATATGVVGDPAAAPLSMGPPALLLAERPLLGSTPALAVAATGAGAVIARVRTGAGIALLLQRFTAPAARPAPAPPRTPTPGRR